MPTTFGLDDNESDKRLADQEKFLFALKCHWMTGTNHLSCEHQRVKLATTFLLAAYIGSWPTALLGLFVLRVQKTGELALTL